MPYVSPAAVVSGAVISKTTFGDVVKADLDFLANPPACRATHSTTQAVTSGTEISVAFNAEDFDTNSMHDTVTNNSRITINTAGLYIVSWGFSFTADTDYNWAYSYLRLNGATVIGLGATMGTLTDAGLSPQIAGSVLYKFAATNYVEIRAGQKNTSATANSIQATPPYFSAVWVGLG